MGCCEARDKVYFHDKDRLSGNSKSFVMPFSGGLNPTELPLQTAANPLVSASSKVIDSKADELETYALDLIQSTEGWRLDYQEPGILIKHLNVPLSQFSKFHPDARVMYCSIEFHRKIPHQVLMDVLEQEAVRKRWDSKVQHIKITQEQDGTRIVYSKFSKLIFTRELVEKRVTKTFPEELRVIYYSPGVPDPTNTEKAFTFFGLHRFITRAEETTLLIFSQTDFRIPEPLKKAMRLMKGEAGKWLKSCRDQVLAHTF